MTRKSKRRSFCSFPAAAPAPVNPADTILPSHSCLRSWDYAAVGVAVVEATYATIINGSYSTHGTIVLSHELDNETMQLSKDHLPAIREKFTGGVMPVGVCQNWTQIYGEGSGYEYPNYAQWVAGTRSISVAAPTAYSSELAFATDAVVTSSGLPSGAAPTTSAAAAVTAVASAKSTTASSSSAKAPSSASGTGAATNATAATGTAAAAKVASASPIRVEGAFKAGALVLAVLVGGAMVLA